MHVVLTWAPIPINASFTYLGDLNGQSDTPLFRLVRGVYLLRETTFIYV